MVGMTAGKTIASALKKPFFGTNHLEGHALSPGLETNIAFPYLLLLISGGHTQFLIVKNINHYEQLGTTIDDALGEAFDKTAKMLDLGYPGGPSVEKFAKLGDKNYFKLPEPIINKGIKSNVVPSAFVGVYSLVIFSSSLYTCWVYTPFLKRKTRYCFWGS